MVLFADVTGSTELGESLDPEDVRALLGRFYAVAKDVVGSHGGTVEKFIGDAVMAVFGLPTAHGDDAVRAVSAALEIRDRVRHDPRPHIRFILAVAERSLDTDSFRSLLTERVDLFPPEVVEFSFARLCDEGVVLGADLLDAVELTRSFHSSPLVQAQVRRARGIASRDPDELGRSLAVFERCGCVPSVARVRIERGLLAGSEREIAEGMGSLESLGDVEQIERYERRRRG